MAVSVFPNDLVIRITSLEAERVLAIHMDGNGEDALRFLREKIMEKLLNSSCQPLFNLTRKRCIPGCKNPCCLTGHNLRTKS